MHTVICPNCNAQLHVTSDILKCEYCNTEIILDLNEKDTIIKSEQAKDYPGNVMKNIKNMKIIFKIL